MNSRSFLAASGCTKAPCICSVIENPIAHDIVDNLDSFVDDGLPCLLWCISPMSGRGPPMYPIRILECSKYRLMGWPWMYVGLGISVCANIRGTWVPRKSFIVFFSPIGEGANVQIRQVRCPASTLDKCHCSKYVHLLQRKLVPRTIAEKCVYIAVKASEIPRPQRF